MLITTEGSAEIFTDMERIKNILEGPGTSEILNAFGDAAVSHAKQVVPVDTGRLRNSINFQVTGDNTGTFSANTEYAIFVELGTRNMNAQPFMQPAAFVGLRTMMDALTQILKI